MLVETVKRMHDDSNVVSDADDEYSVFCGYLESACGITLGDNRHYLVKSRLRGILEKYGLYSLKQLVDLATTGSIKYLGVEIVDAMTTNETSWFRDVYPFEYLKESILPELSENPVAVPRVWSAACSWGHEPYSISISVQEYLEKNPGQFSAGVDILGTDISTRVLEQARLGVYDDLNLSRGLSADRRRKFFERGDKHSRIGDRVRQRVKFFEVNLLRGFSILGNFDVIFCRNVLIYFSNENKSIILDKINSAMNPRAWLFLGASEPIINYSDAFEMINCPRGVVYRKKT